MARGDSCFCFCCCHPTATPGERQPLPRDSQSQHLSTVTLSRPNSFPGTTGHSSGERMGRAGAIFVFASGCLGFRSANTIFVRESLSFFAYNYSYCYFFLFHCCIVFFQVNGSYLSSESQLLESYSWGAVVGEWKAQVEFNSPDRFFSSTNENR